MKKRIISCLLVLTLVVGVFPISALAAGTALPFSDVDASDWYYDAVAYVYENDLMQGVSATRFAPQGSLTRAMFVTILGRLDGVTEAAYPGSSFSDVPTGQWYSAYVQWAAETEIVTGYGNGQFGPTDPVTREQMAVILYRYAQLKGYDTTVSGSLSAFSDAAKVSAYALDAMKWAVGSNLISGTENGALSPQGIATRIQTATILMRFCEGVVSGNNADDSPATIDTTSHNSGNSTPSETTATGKITYKAPTESDIDYGSIEYEGQTYSAEYVNNQLIVVFYSSVNRSNAEKLIESYDASIVGEIETIRMYQIEFPSSKTLTELNSILNELKEEDIVEDAYLNTVVECESNIDPYYPDDTWDINNGEVWNELFPSGNNWGAEAINAPSAWRLLLNKYGTISQIPSVRVGIIDSYFDMMHDDLDISAVYWYQTGSNVFKKNQTDTTAAEYAAAAENFEDFAHIIHGTHVMGTIGATINNVNNGGINGIAINPELYGVSIAEAGEIVIHTRFGLSTALSNLIEDSHCQVINYSKGYTNYNPLFAKVDTMLVGNVLKKYLNKNHDFLIVASAGNDSSRDAQYGSIFSGISDATVKSHIIIVGNAKNDNDGTVSLYTDGSGQCYGSRIDVVAPGTGIYSTVSPNERSFRYNNSLYYTANSNYMLATGTSMSAPHVSGVAALVWAANPTLTGDRVKDIIIDTANIIVDGKDAGGYSHRMVNAAYAVSKALGLEYTVNGTCGSNMTWTLDTAGNLTIQGTGEMAWESTYAPWHRYCEAIQNITIEDGVTSVYTTAFLDCCNVSTVELGNSIKSVGDAAFAEMTSLKSIIIPSSVQEIGDVAFGYAFNGEKYMPVSGFTIYGYTGTAAETYAKDNGFKFIDLASENPDEPVDPIILPTVSGTVKDSSTQLPLEDVDVYVYDENGYGPLFTAKTGSDGAFSITLKESGVYTVKFSKDGYQSKALSNITILGSFFAGEIRLYRIPDTTDFLADISAPDSNAIVITTAEELSMIESGSYVLGADIDLRQYNGGEWIPITPSGDIVLDGQGHIITGLYCSSDLEYGGLFGQISSCSVTIKNLGMTQIDLNANVYNGGLIASYTNRGEKDTDEEYETLKISNCFVSGNCKEAWRSGLLVGAIENYTKANSFGNYKCQAYTTVAISDSYVNGIVLGNQGESGGFIGRCSSLSESNGSNWGSLEITISNSISYADISDNTSGGFVGNLTYYNADREITFSNCKSYAVISGKIIGGMVGDAFSFPLLFEDCIVDCNYSSTSEDALAAAFLGRGRNSYTFAWPYLTFSTPNYYYGNYPIANIIMSWEGYSLEDYIVNPDNAINIP